MKKTPMKREYTKGGKKVPQKQSSRQEDEEDEPSMTPLKRNQTKKRESSKSGKKVPQKQGSRQQDEEDEPSMAELKKGQINRRETSKGRKKSPSKQISRQEDEDDEPTMPEMVLSRHVPEDGSGAVQKVSSGESTYFAAMMGTHAVKSLDNLAVLEPQINTVTTDVQNTCGTHAVQDEQQKTQFYAHNPEVETDFNTASRKVRSKEAISPRGKAQKAITTINVKADEKVKDKRKSIKKPQKTTIQRMNTTTKKASPPRGDSVSKRTKTPPNRSTSPGRSSSTTSVTSIKSAMSDPEIQKAKKHLTTTKAVNRSGEKTSTQKEEQTTGAAGETYKKQPLGKTVKQGRTS